MSLRSPLELGLGAYLGGFYASLYADTQSMVEYAARGLSKSIVWVPGRMVDDVEHMIAEWRKNENNPGPGLSSMLPVIFVALAKDFQPVMPEMGVATTRTDFAFPDDPLGRSYKVLTSTNDYRAQIAIVAPEGATAHSLAMQLHVWASQGPTGRRFTCNFEFAGFTTPWPAMLETIDIAAVSAPVEQKNLTILVADLTIRATIPIFSSPKAGEPNDGKATPAGYPVVVDFTSRGTSSGATSETVMALDGTITETQT